MDTHLVRINESHYKAIKKYAMSKDLTVKQVLQIAIDYAVHLDIIEESFYRIKNRREQTKNVNR
jgi:uncharacterized protein (DUF2344 family)